MPGRIYGKLKHWCITRVRIMLQSVGSALITNYFCIFPLPVCPFCVSPTLTALNLRSGLHLPRVCEPYAMHLAVFDLNWFAVTSGRNMRFGTLASQCPRMVMHGQARTIHTASPCLPHTNICASLFMRKLHQILISHYCVMKANIRHNLRCGVTSRALNHPHSAQKD